MSVRVFMAIQQIAVEEFYQTLPIKEPRCYDPAASYRYQQKHVLCAVSVCFVYVKYACFYFTS